MDIPKFDYLWQYVDYWATQDPDFPLIRFKWKKYNAKEFKEAIDQLAKAFISLGVKRGDRIITILPMTMEFALIYIASNSIGAICVPMDVRYRPADYRRFIPHIKPKVIILIGKARGYDIAETIRNLGSEFNPDIKYYMVGRDDFGKPFEELLSIKYDLEDDLEEARKSLEPDDGALIIFTGGTTGNPKAAMLSHRNIARASYHESNYIGNRIENFGVEQRFKILVNLPASHVGGPVEIMGTGLAGGNQLILQEQWNPYSVLRISKKENVPLIGGVPTMYAIILSLPDIDDFNLSMFKVAVVSGEKLSLELLTGMKEKICPNILNAYGSTESGPEVTFTELGDPLEELAQGYIGKLLPEQEVKIIDDNGNEVPDGKIGEMLFRGSQTINEYFNMPEENKATFTKDGWCKSGDLGYRTNDGRLYIKGRKKFIIRVGGYTVLPSEVEEVAIQHPNVAMAAAIGFPDKIYGDVVWLAVVLEAGKRVDENEIIDLCKEQLADFKVPKKIIFEKELPITRLGKIDRPTLRNKYINSMK